MKKQKQSPAKLTKLADAVLIVGGIFSLFVLSYFLYRYYWTGASQFSGSMGMMLYYVVPAGVAALLFASLRLRPAYKIALAILCLSLTASLYVAEYFLFVSEKPVWVGVPKEKKNEITQLARQYGVDFDTRDNLEVLADLQRQGVEAVRPVVLPMLEKRDGSMKSAINIRGSEVIPLGGIADKVTVLCNQSGQWITYKSDAYGFHNPRKIWESGHVEIAALGNSFTQGYCVPSGKNFAALIRSHYPATLNLGMAGEGPLLMLAMFNEFLPPFKPKVVLWFYFEGDHLFDLQKETKSHLLMRYLKDNFTQDLAARQRDIDRAILDYVEKRHAKRMTEPPTKPNGGGERLDQLPEIINLAAMRRKLGLVYGTTTEEQETIADLKGEAMDLFRDILSQAKSRVSSWNGKLYFIYLPSWGRYANKNPGNAGKQRTTVLMLAKKLGLDIIDMNPVFEAQDDPLSLFPFRRFHHYNEQGHQVVAREVLRAISKSM